MASQKRGSEANSRQFHDGFETKRRLDRGSVSFEKVSANADALAAISQQASCAA